MLWPPPPFSKPPRSAPGSRPLPQCGQASGCSLLRLNGQTPQGNCWPPSPGSTPALSPGSAESWTLRHSQGLFSAAFPPGPPVCSEVLPQSGTAGSPDGLSLDPRTLHFPGRTLLRSTRASSSTGERAAPLLLSWKQDWHADTTLSSFCQPCLGSTVRPDRGPLLPLKAEPCSKNLSWGQSPCRTASNSSLTSPAAEPFHEPRAPPPTPGSQPSPVLPTPGCPCPLPVCTWCSADTQPLGPQPVASELELRRGTGRNPEEIHGGWPDPG